MTMLSGLRPTHPGELLREDVLPAIGRPRAEIARNLGISRQTLYDILNEAQPVTTAMALKIGKLTGTSAEMWLRMQQAHDLNIERARIAEELSRVPTLAAA